MLYLDIIVLKITFRIGVGFNFETYKIWMMVNWNQGAKITTQVERYIVDIGKTSAWGLYPLSIGVVDECTV